MRGRAHSRDRQQQVAGLGVAAQLTTGDGSYTSTALNNFRGTRSLEQGAREPVRLALLGDDGPTGTFSDESGPVPW